jgi:uncharacterized RDD family membrane protein YckC
MPIDIENAQAPGLLRRLAAMFYDFMLLAALLMLAGALVVVPLGMGFDIDSEVLARHPLFRLYLFLVILGFFCGFWIRGGQTLGMRAWRLMVVRYDGNRLHLRDALARFAAAALSWTVLGAGFLWSLLDREKLTWHDRLSGTRLVMLKKPEKR